MVKLALVALVVAACGDNAEPCGPDNFCARLSGWHLFDNIADQTPAPGVVPYDVNTALFSDYATKNRFLVLPQGAPATWSDHDALDLPVGTLLVKTFSYLHDRRDPTLGRTLLETRVLVHGDAGWHGAAYVYNDDGHDATLQIAGAILDESWIHDDGSQRTDEYVVPNENQCKNCHAEHDNTLTPLGPKVRHLNKAGQLEAMIADGSLVGAPDPAMWMRAPDAFDPSSGTLDQRARAWLDINCGHCHNPTGAARTSGLFLDVLETDPAVFGVCKPPVATGRGSGGFQFDIVPGKPDESIMVYRISSTEPEIKMPELGRNLVHAEGVALIRDWISAMPGGCTGFTGRHGQPTGHAPRS
ncbi:MAG: hypothetical protein JO257_11920 [Deltaproteobacteria bacterium]|nr:hypothetical protein [Deltaproteobacteria bacterium]